MNVKLLKNNDDSLSRCFTNLLEKESLSLDMAVAYASHKAYKKFKSEFSIFLARGGAIRAIFDLAERMTDPDVIEELLTAHGDVKCKLYFGKSGKPGIFHHKFYRFESEGQTSVIVGSANFTGRGFSTNGETAVCITTTPDSEFAKGVSKHFSDIWMDEGVILADDNQEILNDYRELYESRSKPKNNLDPKMEDLHAKIAEKAEYAIKFVDSRINPKIAYLLGLLAASIKSRRKVFYKQDRIVKLCFNSQVMNTSEEKKHLEGFIAAEVNGKLLGDICLRQFQTQIKAVEKIKLDLLENLRIDSNGNTVDFKDKTKKQLALEIKLGFTQESNIWPHIEKYIDHMQKDERGYYVPCIPRVVAETSDPRIKIHFLRGYMDFRGRLSQADRYAGGRMRVGIQISTNAVNFAGELEKLAKEFNFGDFGLLNGKTRNKDNVIRFEPTKNAIDLFNSGWQRSLLGAFIDFNKNLREKKRNGNRKLL